MTRVPLIRIRRGLMFLACLFIQPLAAQSPEDVQALLNDGDYEAAVAESKDYLEEHPDNPRARFLHGLALAEAEQRAQAIEVFGELVRDYPHDPAPANNLAVLYAQQGEYEKARRWLEAAMATHPAYATAHKNLGDVYTALAAAAYSKALNEQDQVDLGVTLDYVDDMATPDEADSGKAQDDQGMRVVPAPEPAPEPARPPQQPPASTEEPPAEEARPQSGAESAVVQAVKDWAQAWSDQDVAAYLDAYADNFYPGDDLTIAEWREQRRERLQAPEHISVEVIEPRVEFPEQGRARVTFEQVYESDTYADRVEKTLVLERDAGDWRIVRETSD